MGILERIGSVFSPAAPKPSEIAPAKPTSKYLNENRGNGIMQSVQPALRSARNDVRSGWARSAAHSLDLAHNSGFVAGMMDAFVTELVGTGLDLDLEPNAKFLGMTEEGAWDWAADVEDRFWIWASRAYACDLEDRNNFYRFQAQQARAYVLLGETFSHIAWHKRFGAPWGTKFKSIPAYALQDKNNGKDVIQGVRITEAGSALGYHFNRKTEYENGVQDEVYISRRDRFGRPQIIHTFDGLPGQVRGITPLAPALQVVRQFDRLQDATLTAATLQTIFAATIKSELPSADVLQLLAANGEGGSGLDTWLEASIGWAKNTDINLGIHGKIPHLLPTEELDMKTPGHPGGHYVDFAKFLLHEIARCLGLTFETATGDYSAATYASLNIGEAKNDKLFDMRREQIMVPMCEDIFMAWLEEDIQEGHTKFPGGHAGFLANRYAAFTTKWRGPGKPQADDLKYARALEVFDNLGIMSQTEMAASLGKNITAEYKKRRREMTMRKALGLREPVKQRVPDVEEQQLIADSTQDKAA